MRTLIILFALTLAGCGGDDQDVTSPKPDEMTAEAVLNNGGVPEGKDVIVTLKADETFKIDGTNNIVVKGKLTIK